MYLFTWSLELAFETFYFPLLGIAAFGHRLRATTSVVVKMCKMQKVLNFANFNPKNISINLCKNVQIYTTIV